MHSYHGILSDEDDLRKPKYTIEIDPTGGGVEREPARQLGVRFDNEVDAHVVDKEDKKEDSDVEDEETEEFCFLINSFY